MSPAALVLLSLLATPAVTAGPDLAEQAQVVEAPIEQVTVFSDRARVRRRARPQLGAGIHSLRLPDLPGSILLDTVRVSARGATVLRIEATPVERERWSLDQVEVLLEKIETLRDQAAGLRAQEEVYAIEVELLAQLQPKAALPEKDRVGRPRPAPLPALWRQIVAFAGQRAAQARAKMRELQQQRRALDKELVRLRREVDDHDLGAFSDQKVQVLAIIELAQGGRPQVEVEYFVPGASWRPNYELHYLAAQGSIALNVAGAVQQASGEDWTDVELALSTAIPGQGIDLPELLTWTLGEKREFVPQVRAARMPQEPPRFPTPRAQPTLSEARRQATLELLRERMSELQNLASNGLADASGSIDIGGWGAMGSVGATGHGSGGAGMASSVVATRGMGRATAATSDRRRASRAMAPPPPPSPAPRRSLAQAPGAPMPAMEAMAMDMDDSGVDSYAEAEEEPLQMRDSAIGGSVRARPTSLGLFEPAAAYREQTFSDRNLPAVLAGGMDYVYECPTKVSIPSSGEQVAVPLAVETHPAEVRYVATPALKTTAYLEAKVTHKGRRPILGGPVNIFMGRDFAGQGQLATTGPGGVLTLPLGADENLRLKRTVVPASSTDGVFKKEDITTYTVTLEVGNYKKRPVRIVLIDVLPKSNHKDVEIKMVSAKPKLSEGPDEDGVVRWELDIPAGKTQTVEFVYRIQRPENWQLYQ